MMMGLALPPLAGCHGHGVVQYARVQPPLEAGRNDSCRVERHVQCRADAGFRHLRGCRGAAALVRHDVDGVVARADDAAGVATDRHVPRGKSRVGSFGDRQRGLTLSGRHP